MAPLVPVPPPVKHSIPEIPFTTATPVPVPGSTTAFASATPSCGTAAAVNSTPPKKHCNINGVTKLNPEYKRWKEAEDGKPAARKEAEDGKPSTTAIISDQSLTTHSLSQETLEVLKQQGYSLGLTNTLSVVKETFARRIILIDNSGSMQRNDGHRMVDNKECGVIKIVPCSRWEEVRESINYHIRLTGLIQAPTSFRLLNHPGASVGTQLFGVAEQGCGHARITSDIDQGLSIMGRAQPTGCTPLTEHMQTIYNEVCEAAPMLRARGQRISITICTDGLPSDPHGRGGPEHNRAFVDSLRQLEGLPVWIVVRLCTDEDDVVDFYNNLDGQLEVSIEVLDDLVGEAQEIYQVNPWLNYGLPLHRLRELGFHDRVMDMLDERALTLTELRTFCSLLFGQDKLEGVPDPSVNWTGFRNVVDQLLKTERLQWQNPRTKRMEPWINMKTLDFLYGDSCNHLPCHPMQLFRFFQMFRFGR